MCLFCLFLFLVWSYFKVVSLCVCVCVCVCVFVLFVFVFSVELF